MWEESPSSDQTVEGSTDNHEGNSNTGPVSQQVPQPGPQPVPSLDGLPASSASNGYSLLVREHGIASLCFVIDPSAPRAGKAAPWEATFTVNCADVPRLMREGLFWSTDNIVPEEGFVRAAHPQSRALGYSHVRTQILTDKPESRGGHGGLEWVASFEVAATAIETLTGFRPQNRNCVEKPWPFSFAQYTIYAFSPLPQNALPEHVPIPL